MFVTLNRTHVTALPIDEAIKIVADQRNNLWRPSLIERLYRVDDSRDFPVMTFSTATFTLAQTSSLDKVLISPSGEDAPYWNGKKLADISYHLLSHHVAEHQLSTCSFYWQFQHDDSGPNGYMVDTIFPKWLVVASWANSDPGLWAATLVDHEVLLGSISSERMLWERLYQEGNVYSTIYENLV